MRRYGNVCIADSGGRRCRTVIPFNGDTAARSRVSIEMTEDTQASDE